LLAGDATSKKMSWGVNMSTELAEDVHVPHLDSIGLMGGEG
jgi:hypothetical protein